MDNGNEKKEDNSYQRGNLRIPRETLRKMLISEIEGHENIEILWGKRLHRFTEEAKGKVELEFEDNDTSSVKVDLLIG